MPLSLKDRLFIKLGSIYTRITLTRVTTAFFLFGFFHCFAQGIINGFLFTVDARSASLVTSVLVTAKAPINSEIAWFRGKIQDRRLDVCYDIPLDLNGRPEPCKTAFRNSDVLNPSEFPPTLVMTWAELGSVTLAGIPQPNATDMRPVQFTYNNEQSTTTVSVQCSYALMYARQVLINMKREDITTVAFQFWLFAISTISVLYDSIPHTLALLIARALFTGWSAFALWRTTNIRRRFDDLIIEQGTACGIDFGFGDFFVQRIHYEIPDLLLNITALCISLYLSFTLLKMYKQQTFSYIGASAQITRIYRFFMAILVCLQLEFFILMSAMCLWVDQLFNTAIESISDHTPVYKSLFIGTTTLLVPWFVAGWISVRKEWRLVMGLHLVLTVSIITCWSIMFVSQVYRWTYMEWPFLACLTTASFILLVASMVLGVTCFFNFNKGLAHYLHVESKLASSDFEPEVFTHVPGPKSTPSPLPNTFVVSLESPGMFEKKGVLDV